MIDQWYVGEPNVTCGCDVCGKYSEHADWCIIVNAAVQYAVTVVTKGNQFMSQPDRVRLLGMGVKWVDDEAVQ